MNFVCKKITIHNFGSDLPICIYLFVAMGDLRVVSIDQEAVGVDLQDADLLVEGIGMQADFKVLV